MAFVPFSSRAKKWEPVAQALRRMAGVAQDQLLDPWVLASNVNLHVRDDSGVFSCIPHATGSHLLGDARRCWSGGVLPVPLPDGKHLCILNPTHPYRRNKITLMEEIVHMHLKHEPTRLICAADGADFRDYDKTQELEAYGVGAAALLPWSSFFTDINRGENISALSEKYDVTPDLISYRIKITGAFRLYQARQRESA